MMKLDPFLVVEARRLQSRPHRGMEDLGYGPDSLDVRPDYAMPNTEERRHMAAGYVAVLVDCHREYRTAMLQIPVRIVGAAAKEGNAVRGPRNRHVHRLSYTSLPCGLKSLPLP